MLQLQDSKKIADEHMHATQCVCVLIQTTSDKQKKCLDRNHGSDTEHIDNKSGLVKLS